MVRCQLGIYDTPIRGDLESMTPFSDFILENRLEIYDHPLSEGVWNPDILDLQANRQLIKDSCIPY